MFENLKKKSIKKVLVVSIIFMAVGFLFVAFQISDLLTLMKGHKKFEELQVNEIKQNIIVDTTTEINFGAFLEEYEENTSTHVTRTTDMYYVIWTGDMDDIEYRYMAIKVPASDIPRMDAMAEVSFYGETSEPIHFSGTIKKMNNEEWRYFKEYFEEWGMTEEDMEAFLIPYYIEAGALVGSDATFVYVLLVFGLVLMAMGVIFLVTTANGSTLKSIKKELEDCGITEDSAEAEYEEARIYDDMRIGNRLIFYMNGSTPHVMPIDKLVWAYQNTTTHRTNGIKTGTTYSVVLSTIEKKTISVSVPSENIAIDALQDIKQNLPWAIVGYSDDLRKMYNKEFENFLGLHYNKVKNGQFY